MELEAREASEAKQRELAPGSRVLLPQLRVVLNRFSLASSKAACDHHWGRGPNSAETGGLSSLGQNLAGTERGEAQQLLYKRGNTHTHTHKRQKYTESQCQEWVRK